MTIPEMFAALDRIIADPNVNDEIGEVARTAGLPRADVRNLLAQAAIEDAAAEVDTYKGTSIVGAIVFSVLSVALPLWALGSWAGRYTRPAVVVKADGGLAAYQQIGSDDVAIEKRKGTPLTIPAVSDVVGRFVTRAYRKGDAIDKSSVSKAGPGFNWSGTLSVAVQVKAFKVDYTLLPQKITLMGVPKKDGVTSLFRMEAILLDGDDAKDAWVRVAVKQGDLAKLQAALAQSDLYLVQELR
jgi:hypothetical protein